MNFRNFFRKGKKQPAKLPAYCLTQGLDHFRAAFNSVTCIVPQEGYVIERIYNEQLKVYVMAKSDGMLVFLTQKQYHQIFVQKLKLKDWFQTYHIPANNLELAAVLLAAGVFDEKADGQLIEAMLTEDWKQLNFK